MKTSRAVWTGFCMDSRASARSSPKALLIKCNRLDGINLAQGICDTDLPASVADQAIKAIRSDQNIYTHQQNPHVISTGGGAFAAVVERPLYFVFLPFG